MSPQNESLGIQDNEALKDIKEAAPSNNSQREQRTPNPYKEASFLSRLIFLWPYPLLKLGMERPLEDSDLPCVLEDDTSKANRNYFEMVWEEEKKKRPKKPSLHRAILRDFFRDLWYVQPLMMMSSAAKVMQAVALGLLIETFESGGDGGYLWASVLVFSGFLVLMEHHHVFLYTWHKGMKLRIAAVASIYDKTLRLSSTHQDKSASSGSIINLATNDVERFLMAALFINYLFWAPLQSLAVLAVGIWLLGPAFAAGFALLLVVFIPLQIYLSKRFAHYRSKIAAITDRRVTLVSQAIYGARVMKMSGWEWQFLDRIQAIRKQEISLIEKANQLKSWNETLFFSANVVISITIFMTHIAVGGTLSPRNVFTVMTLVNIVQLEMTKHVSLAVMGVSECYVSIKRIESFLKFPELPNVRETQQLEYNIDDKVAISMVNVDCYWNEDSSNNNETNVKSSTFSALSNISLDFNHGELTCIIGTVGSSKSALLQALVGELNVSQGTLTRNYSSLSYASQDPFLMDGTVRENIVMGEIFRPEWYDRVVNATGLSVDFKQFRNEDQTIVGDRGVQCSGGQRARIGLARAIYRDADVLVCDDPLSAVDAKVGRLIFSEALMGLAVSRGKCVILSTHQHQYINEARCVLMVAGKVQCVGSYTECVGASDGKLTAHAPDSSVENVAAHLPVKTMGVTSIVALDDKLDEKNETDDDVKEQNVTGLVRTATFLSYARAMGGVWKACLLILLFIITQGSVLITIAVLGRWAERPAEDQRSWDVLGLVIGLGVCVVVLALVRALISFRMTLRASQRLHDRMTKAVLRAKIEFFDTNPSGRILNRFSADVGSNDDLLPPTIFDFMMILFVVLGALITTVSVLPFTLIAFPPLIFYFLSVRRIFVTTTRELKRLEGLARSPIFAMMGESLSGIATIRANESTNYFKQKFQDAHDTHTRAFFGFMSSSRWVGFRMDSIMFLFLSFAVFLAVLFHQQGWFEVDASLLGLAISMLLQLAGIFQWCIRQSAEVVNQMVSVERVLGFSNLPSEAELESDLDKTLGDWPKGGVMKVNNLNVRYRKALPLSLENVSFEIPSGARVGVVGRTGSGKSTLVQCIFRLLEAENGSIQLDDIDIASVGLHTLRTRLSVIPQVPVLFSGCTVRENLDPFTTHSDEEIQEALQDVHMLSVIEGLPFGIASMVSEGGSNFSVGQRQLLCLARAILRKSPFLILDEPTANVDRRTDQLLQEALQKSFHQATIVSVAHRLDTVIDYDYILVLGAGRVLEFGSPAELVDKEGGHFASMINDTGENMSQDLRRRAKKVN
jgi:ATP-binding cassette, subfamily C (CFTR/MRP), member 4